MGDSSPARVPASEQAEPLEPGEEIRQDTASATDDPTAADEAPFEPSGSGKLLRSRDLLTSSEASASLAESPGYVVVWAGERKSGKTTLTAELYERHRQGTASTRFVGSRTLLGLEERMHPARSASGRVKPHTPRTEQDPEGRDILHFQVQDGEQGPIHLLFGETPGEVFKRIRDADLPPDDVPLLARADKLAFLLDGEGLADPGRRSMIASSAQLLIRRFRDAGLPESRCQTMLVVTKLDQIEAAGENAISYLDKTEKRILPKLREIDSDAKLLRTSARGETSSERGLDELMSWLLDEPAIDVDEELPELPPASRRLQRLRQPKGLR